MKITLLGTGDAIGTPKVGCSCPQCSHARTNGLARLRTSLLVENEGHHILVDSSPDLRQQLLQHGSPHIDAVIWTHGHYDHFMGFGEFYRVQDIPTVYASGPVMEYCADIFRFLSFQRRVFMPYESFLLFGITLTPFLVTHPPAHTCGLLLDTGKSRVGFTSDTNSNLPQQTIDLLEDLDLLLLDALVPSEITTIHKHMNYAEAKALANRISPGDFRCIHQSHLLPWDLPHCSRDGDIFEFP